MTFNEARRRCGQDQDIVFQYKGHTWIAQSAPPAVDDLQKKQRVYGTDKNDPEFRIFAGFDPDKDDIFDVVPRTGLDTIGEYFGKS